MVSFSKLGIVYRLAILVWILTYGSGLTVANAQGLQIAPNALEPVFDKLFDSPSGPETVGAVVAIVQNGEVVLVKSYGKDSVAGGAVDVDKTTFYLASVTKTFAGLSIAQLVERGAIDSIDDPVNKYITRFKVADNNGAPITIRHLLTHQPGYADRNYPRYATGVSVPDFDKSYHERWQPRYVVPAGVISSYSNYGAGLLRVLVEDVTGQSIEAYFAENVFGPGGMDSAIIRTHPGSTPQGAQGAELYPNGTRVPIPNDWAQAPALITAGGFDVSGGDMARYMIGLMGGSEKNGIPALTGEKGRALMFTRHGGSHPAVTGFGTMFFLSSWNGEKLAEHTGLGPGSRTSMTLLPDRKIGVFAAYSGATAPSGLMDTIQQMVGQTPKRFVPVNQDAPIRPRISNILIRSTYLEALLGKYSREVDVIDETNLEQYVGRYTSIRRDPDSLLSFRDIFFKRKFTTVVKPDGDGGLSIGEVGGYRPIGDDAFYKDLSLTNPGGTGWREVFAFVKDEHGKITYAADLYGAEALYKVAALHDPNILRSLLFIGMLMSLLGAPIFVWRSSLGLPLWYVSMSAVLPIFVWALPFCFYSALADEDSIIFKFVYAHSENFTLFAMFANITGLMALIVGVGGVFIAFRKSTGGIWPLVAKSHLLILSVGTVMLFVSFVGMNLIGWNLP